MTLARLACIASTLLLACGSSPAPSDAGTDADAGSDAPVTGCNLSAPFGQPVAIAELNTSDYEDSPRLTHDELTIYFARAPGGQNRDLYVATRSSPTGAFGQPTPLAALNTTGDELWPSPTGDDLGIYFSSTGPGSLGPQPNVLFASRTSTASDFGAPTNVTSLNQSSDDTVAPYVMPDGQTIYFASSRANGNDEDLFRATATNGSFVVDATDPFSAINQLVSTETSPVVTVDELTVYFLSDRDSWHVYQATRASKSDAFGAPTPVFELDSSITQPGFVSDDGCRIYVSEESASGDTNLFVATKPAK